MGGSSSYMYRENTYAHCVDSIFPDRKERRGEKIARFVELVDQLECVKAKDTAIHERESMIDNIISDLEAQIQSIHKCSVQSVSHGEKAIDKDGVYERHLKAVIFDLQLDRDVNRQSIVYVELVHARIKVEIEVKYLIVDDMEEDDRTIFYETVKKHEKVLREIKSPLAIEKMFGKQYKADDATKEDATKEEVTKEEVTKEEVTKEDTTKEDATKEDNDGSAAEPSTDTSNDGSEAESTTDTSDDVQTLMDDFDRVMTLVRAIKDPTKEDNEGSAAESATDVSDDKPILVENIKKVMSHLDAMMDVTKRYVHLEYVIPTISVR
jgi:hypothetical protein